MRNLVVSLPQNYREYDLSKNYIDFIFNKKENADVIIYNQSETGDIYANKYIVLDIKDINVFNLDNECKNEIDIFLVYDIYDYENLSMQFEIDKKKIFLIDENSLEESYSQLFKKIYNELKEILYDIEISLNPDKWLSTNSNLKKYKNNNKLVFEDYESEQPYYIAYGNLGSFGDSKIYNFNVDSDKTYKIEFNCDFQGSISCELFIIEFSDNEKIDTHTIGMKSTKYFIPNEKTTRLRIAIRVNGKGKIILNNVIFRDYHKEYIYNDFNNISSKDKYLVLTNVYPSHADLYRNGFVHRRVLLYKEQGLDLDIFAMSNDKFLQKYNFDNVDVFSGNPEVLKMVLRKNNYRKILIHFVNQDMVNAIKEVNTNIPLIIWIHGFETERWHRRIFNYTKEEIESKKKEWEKSDEIKMKFMRELYLDENNKFIFVSKWFKEAVAEEDTGCKVKNYEIIPNVVDEDLFKYRRKTKEMRKKILTIRPFASMKYANDLSVKAILELSKETFFNELQFTIIGDGKLFDETLEPLRKFDNVIIKRGFLNQREIVSFHRKNGIFLCPTRLDAQGVSMCEAMSSGLIPITNGVTAIPEFVSKESGFLAEENDYLGLARGIEELYKSPELFSEMLANASSSIRKASGKNHVIEQEVKAIKD